jgi:hypothetical protein
MLSMIVSYVIPSLPIALTYLVGIVLALATWKRHPRPSLYALIGLLVMVVGLVAGMVFTLLQQRLYFASADVVNPRLVIYTIQFGFPCIRGLIGLVGWGFIFAAIFLPHPEAPIKESGDEQG